MDAPNRYIISFFELQGPPWQNVKFRLPLTESEIKNHQIQFYTSGDFRHYFEGTKPFSIFPGR